LSKCFLSTAIASHGAKDQSYAPLEGIDCFSKIIPGVEEVPCFQFYLYKSGKVLWVSTTTGTFDGVCDWTFGAAD